MPTFRWSEWRRVALVSRFGRVVPAAIAHLCVKRRPHTVKALLLTSLIILASCAAPHRDVSVTLLPPMSWQPTTNTVSFAPNAWIRDVTPEDILYVKSALAQITGRYEVKNPIISLGKGATPEGEHIIAYTTLYSYEFARPAGGRWCLLRCTEYTADSLP